MTRKEILAMKPGRELDEEIAWLVMGYDSIPDDGLPRFSTEIEAAWEVAEHVKHLHLYRWEKIAGGPWECKLRYDDKPLGYCRAATAPEAICKAALLTMEDAPMG